MKKRQCGALYQTEKKKKNTEKRQSMKTISKGGSVEIFKAPNLNMLMRQIITEHV